MHIIIGCSLIAAAYLHGDIKKWRHYHSTMLFVSLLVLLYNVLCHDKLLWVHSSDILGSHVLVELVHSLIIMPFIALLFLASFPDNIKKQILYIFNWVICSLLIEWILVKMDHIHFHNGYEFWMEIPFYIVMYLVIWLHHIHPLITYVLSMVIIVTLMVIFDIPFG